MKVVLLCPDASTNGLSRTLVLAETLAPVADVRIVGTSSTGAVWPPARNCAVPIDVMHGGSWFSLAASLRSLLRRLADADVVIARKPLLASLGVAQLLRKRRGNRIVVDIDDDEVAFRQVHGLARIRSAVHPNGYTAARVMQRRLHQVDGTLVATHALQRVFGGMVVPHVRNTDVLMPRPHLAETAKARLGVTGQRVVMFMGTPRPHKGIEDAARAVAALADPSVVLCVVGADSHSYTAELRRRHPEIRYAGPYAFEDTALLLEAADVVVVPQRDTPEARMQLPAKLLDGMALEKPVVSTALSDIPAILADGRGWVVPPGDATALADVIRAVLADPQEARRAGERAREWVVANASYHSLRPQLAAYLHSMATT
jgi:glycosyltransferase involved in cell wall biosynthesis